MFLGSQSKTATLIELKLFGSDHITSESDHTVDPSNLADKWVAQPLKLTTLTKNIYNKETKCLWALSQEQLR